MKNTLFWTVLLVGIGLIFGGCSRMAASKDEPAPWADNDFVGSWTYLNPKSDTVDIHLEFETQGGGQEFETVGDSIVKEIRFTYSYNVHNVTIESLHSMFHGVYNYEFSGYKKDTMILEKIHRFVKWKN